MLLIMANLLFVNSVLSKVGRHDTHALGGGSDFLLGITQRVCCMPAYLSEKHPCFFCGSENVQTAWKKLVSELGGISVSDAQGTYTQHFIYLFFQLDQICEKICSDSHSCFHSSHHGSKQPGNSIEPKTKLC